MSALKDFVVVVKGIIPPALCSRILTEYHDNASEWTPAVVGEGVVAEIRSCAVLGMSLPAVRSANLERQEIDASLFECAGNAMRAYKNKFPLLEVEQDCGYDLLRYRVTGRYGQHVDSCTRYHRTLSCSFALNDNFTGGAWSLFDGTLKFNVPAGAAVMFPSNFMFPHEISPVTAGTRYSIVTWFN